MNPWLLVATFYALLDDVSSARSVPAGEKAMQARASPPLPSQWAAGWRSTDGHPRRTLGTSASGHHDPSCR